LFRADGAGDLSRIHPRANIGIMIQARDDHFIAEVPLLGQGTSEIERQLGHGPSKHHAVGGHAEEVGHGGAGGMYEIVCPAFGRRRTSAVGDRGSEGPCHGLTDDRRGLGAAGSVKVCDAIAQSRKRGPSQCHVEVHSGTLARTADCREMLIGVYLLERGWSRRSATISWSALFPAAMSMLQRASW